MVERGVSPGMPVHLQSQVVPGMKGSLDNFCFMNNQAGQGLVCVIEFQLNIMIKSPTGISNLPSGFSIKGSLVGQKLYLVS